MQKLSQEDYRNMMRGITKSVMGGNFTLFNSYTNQVIKEDSRQASIGFVKFEFVLSLLNNKQTKMIMVRADVDSLMIAGIYMAIDDDSKMQGVIIPMRSLFENTGKAVVMFIDIDARIIGMEVEYDNSKDLKPVDMYSTLVNEDSLKRARTIFDDVSKAKNHTRLGKYTVGGEEVYILEDQLDDTE